MCDAGRGIPTRPRRPVPPPPWDFQAPCPAASPASQTRPCWVSRRSVLAAAALWPCQARPPCCFRARSLLLYGRNGERCQLVVALCPATSVGQGETVWTCRGRQCRARSLCLCGSSSGNTGVWSPPPPSFQPALPGLLSGGGHRDLGVSWGRGMGQLLVSTSAALLRARGTGACLPSQDPDLSILGALKGHGIAHGRSSQSRGRKPRNVNPVGP